MSTSEAAACMHVSRGTDRKSPHRADSGAKHVAGAEQMVKITACRDSDDKIMSPDRQVDNTANLLHVSQSEGTKGIFNLLDSLM